MFLTMFFKTQNIGQTMHLTMLIAHPYPGTPTHHIKKQDLYNILIAGKLKKNGKIQVKGL